MQYCQNKLLKIACITDAIKVKNNIFLDGNAITLTMGSITQRYSPFTGTFTFQNNLFLFNRKDIGVCVASFTSRIQRLEFIGNYFGKINFYLVNFTTILPTRTMS